MQICSKIIELVNAKRIENNAKRILCALPLHLRHPQKRNWSYPTLLILQDPSIMKSAGQN
jgi:hypothetical protein